jgi:LysM repeat protein
MDERRPNRILLRTVAVAGGALAILAACSTGGGGSSGSTTTVATTAFSTIPVQTTTAPQAASGQGGAAGSDGGSASGGATYTVVSGDYFLGIAKKLGVPLQSLLDANGMTTDSLLTPGQKLKVPSANATSSTTASGASGASTSAGSTAPTTTTTLPGAGGTYTVQPNDYWAGIAQKLGVKVEDLTAFNDATASTVIHPGDKLKVPPKSSSSTTVKP